MLSIKEVQIKSSNQIEWKEKLIKRELEKVKSISSPNIVKVKIIDYFGSKGNNKIYFIQDIYNSGELENFILSLKNRKLKKKQS